MASSAKKKKYDSKSEKHLEGGLLVTISPLQLVMRTKSLKDEICSEHFKWVYFFSWNEEESGVFEEESGVFDTSKTHLTLNWPSSDILIDIEVFCK